jgi:hypothetical protein
MDVPAEQIEELKQLFPGVQRCDEGGYAYFLLPDLPLPAGCTPSKIDVLLCPMQRDGYPSRLFFAQKVQSPVSQNWNTACRILERNWQAFSWIVDQPGLRLAQMVAAHLEALQ